MTVWTLPRKEVRSVVLDHSIAVRSAYPTDSEWQQRWTQAVERNVERREIAKEAECAFFRRQA